MRTSSTVLLTSVLMLLTIGFVMLTSTVAVHADPYYYLKRQLVWLAISAAVGLFTARFIDYHLLRRLILPMAVVTLVPLVLVLVPGIGTEINGSYRWIRLGTFSFQPSELAKLSVVIWLAWWMSYAQRWASTFLHGFVLPLLYPGVILVLVMVQPDFGATLLMAMVSGAVLFLAGSRMGYLFVSASAALGGFLVLIMQDDVRYRRLMAFLDPEQYAQREAFQLLQARYAFISGGAWGTGLGQGMQKRFWLPEAHTDFIFAIVGEELGILASLGVLALFMTFFVSGMLIAFRAPDLFGKLLGFGLTLMITLQAMINIAVVTGCIPTKGITLPFISYGGSSLLISFTMTGLLLNIGRHASVTERDRESRLIKDQQHWN